MVEGGTKKTSFTVFSVGQHVFAVKPMPLGANPMWSEASSLGLSTARA